MHLLEVGSQAPEFTGKDHEGKEISLSMFKGKKVILYFYPKDDTPGCTTEACNFRDHYSSLKKKGYEVIGVSVDNEKSHQKFIKKFELPFPLLSDTEKSVVELYGVWGKKKFMGREYMGTNRVTYVINEEGIIDHVITKVDNSNASQQVLDLYE